VVKIFFCVALELLPPVEVQRIKAKWEAAANVRPIANFECIFIGKPDELPVWGRDLSAGLFPGVFRDYGSTFKVCLFEVFESAPVSKWPAYRNEVGYDRSQNYD
jgi:hypothetical protein